MSQDPSLAAPMPPAEPAELTSGGAIASLLKRMRLSALGAGSGAIAEQAAGRAGRMGEWQSGARGAADDAAIGLASAMRSRAAARVGAIVTAGISAWVLVGWSTHSTWMVRIMPGISHYPAPNSALCLLLLAASLWLHLREGGGKWTWAAGYAAAGAAMALAGVTAAEYMLGRDLGVDGVLLPDWAAAEFPEFRGRIGRGACVVVLSMGVVLLLSRARAGGWLVATSTGTVLTLFLSLSGLLGFAFSAPGTSNFWATIGMAAQTSAAGLVLGLSTVLARPDRPLMTTIIAPYAGGFMARRVLVAGLMLPLVVASVEFVWVPANWVGEEAAAAVLVVASMVVLAVVVLVTCRALNRTDEQRRRAEESRTLMLDELDHRVKNTLATVLAVSEHTMAGAPDMAAFQESFRGRIRAMALAHEALASRRWAGVCLRNMVETTVAPFVGAGSPAVRVRGVDVLLSARAALPVVATLHELATNAAKHGALARPGRGPGVDVSWTMDGSGTIVLDWIEAASASGTAARARESGGFGTSLIRGLIAHELKGSTELEIDAAGVRCRMVIPLAGRCPQEEART